jgi:hypothetical protein
LHGYKELFRIPDGDHIRIFTGGGETRDRTCRVIDETHFETSGGYPAPCIISANLRSDWSKLTGA